MRLTSTVAGVSPRGDEVRVPAGTVGVVVSENRSADWYEVEIDASALGGGTPGVPAAFVEAAIGQRAVVARHRVRVA